MERNGQEIHEQWQELLDEPETVEVDREYLRALEIAAASMLREGATRSEHREARRVLHAREDAPLAWEAGR